MSLQINAHKAALLLLDFQNIHLERVSQTEALLANVASTAITARNNGITVIHCRIAFTSEEVDDLPSTNAMLTRLKHNPAYLAQMQADAPDSQFHPALAPKGGDLVIRKRRVAPFRNAPEDFDAMLRAREIDTLFVAGIATGGAVLSTILEAADLDYRLFMLEDGCADPTPATHEFLVHFLQKRATVIKCAELESLIKQ
jgi:nicotinamidase-related amidase